MRGKPPSLARTNDMGFVRGRTQLDRLIKAAHLFISVGTGAAQVLSQLL
jgi:hypothetical protein